MLPRARLANERHTSTLTLTPASLPDNLNSGLERWEPVKNHTGRCGRMNLTWKWDFYVAILSFMIDSTSWSNLVSSCLNHGGAAYLVARATCIVLFGIPLLLFEISIGQLSGMGPWKFFGSEHLRPVFSGVSVFLLINSIYKAVNDSATSLWPVSQTLTLLAGESVGGLLNSTAVTDEMTTSSHQQMQGFTHLDPLTVISLSVTWVLAILTVICGVKFINKVSYLTLLVPWILISTLLGRMIYLDAPEVRQGLLLILAPSWSSLLSISTWIRAVIDTLVSFNLGFGVITFLSSLNKTHKFDCLKTSTILAALHTLVLGVMLVLSASFYIPATSKGGTVINQTYSFQTIANGIERTNASEVWILIFYVAIFMLNIDGLILISNMLAISFSNLTWRPVLAVLIGAFLYVICLPLATRSRDVYSEMMEEFAVDLLPMMSLFLMLVATVCSLRPNNMVDLIEFAAKCKLAFRGQSYVFVAYNTLLPVVLLMCIIDGIVRLSISDSSSSGVMTVMGRSLLCLPWAGLLFTPLYVAVCHYRHLPHSKRWSQLWQKSDYEDWLYRRPQLGDGGDDCEDCSNSIYELPERSGSRPISAYYSSAATLRISDSAAYSAYY